MTNLFKLSALAVITVALGFAQTAPTTTTLSAALGGGSTGAPAPTNACFTSATGITAPSFGSSPVVGVMIGREFILIAATTGNANCFVVQRGQGGTATFAHNSGDLVVVGQTGGFNNSPFVNVAPQGGSGSPCNATTLPYLPIWVVGGPGYNYQNGQEWNCMSGGFQATGVGNWYPINNPEIAPALTDFEVFVPAANLGCVMSNPTGSAGSGNNTFIIDGSVPALKGSSTAGAATVQVSCNLSAAMRTMAGKGITLTSIAVVYGVQTTTATSMATPTISLFNAPVSSTSETASSATLVTTTGLVGGTLTMTPPVASANLTAVSAGQYYTENIALGTPITMNSDLRTYVLTFAILQSASAIQIMTVPGIWLRGTQIPL